jgi:hypothetical protein
MLAAAVGLESPTYMRASKQNSTIEPTLAALENNSPGVEVSAAAGDGDDGEFNDESQREKASEWMRAVSARMAAIRAETLREVNEESRREPKDANASRRSRRERHKKGELADRHKKRAARAVPRTARTNAARAASDWADLVNAGTGLTNRAGPAL